MPSLPSFRFNGFPPSKQSIKSPEEPASVVGVGLWPKAEVRAVSEDTAAWLRATNSKTYELFTELLSPEAVTPKAPRKKPVPSTAGSPAHSTTAGDGQGDS